MANDATKPLALTLGEPAGIGPDITIAAWLRRRELALPAFYLLGDESLIARRAKALGADIRIASVTASEAAAAFADALPVVATGERPSGVPLGWTDRSFTESRPPGGSRRRPRASPGPRSAPRS